MLRIDWNQLVYVDFSGGCAVEYPVGVKSARFRVPVPSISRVKPNWWVVIQRNSLSVDDYIYVAFNKFSDFFIQAFDIVVYSWKFSMLLLYILWDDWPIFMISGSNEQLQLQLEYTLLKPDCHSWWNSKMQPDTLEERYAIKFCFKLGKNATDCFSTVLHETNLSFLVKKN